MATGSENGLITAKTTIVIKYFKIRKMRLKKETKYYTSSSAAANGVW